jgi:hypothetical protein
MKRIIKYSTTILILILGIPVWSAGTRIDWIDGKIRSTGSSSMAIDEHGTPVDMESGRQLSISEARNISYDRAKRKST